MAQWVRLCGVAEAPAAGQVMEAEVEGVAVCLANVDGELSALDNWCPHRRGPLGQGWMEGESGGVSVALVDVPCEDGDGGVSGE